MGRHGASGVASTLALLLAIAGILVTARPAAALNGSWAPAAGLNAVRYGTAAVTGVDGRIYVFSGYGTTVEAYDRYSNSWSYVADYTNPRQWLGAAAGPDGRIYVIGGLDPSNQAMSSVEAYDPHTNLWTSVASMPTARYGLAAATGRDGRIYAIGGQARLSPTNLQTYSTVEAYDAKTNSWSSVASMHTARSYLGAATGGDGRIYAAGGSYTATAEAFDPATGSWTTLPSMSIDRTALAMAVGPDGLVYAIGGYTGTNLCSRPETATVEAFEPDRNSWTTVPSMVSPREGLAAAMGTDGRVYAIGGYTSNVCIYNFITGLSSVEAYSPQLARRLLPALSNGAYGGYRTAVYIQNLGSAAAAVRIQFRSPGGALVGAGEQTVVQPDATWVVRQDDGLSFAPGQAGWGQVNADQPIAVFVNEFAPGGGDGSSYTGMKGAFDTGSTLYAPAVANNAYGGYTTGLGLVNFALMPSTISITYRDTAGTDVNTQVLPDVPAGAYVGIFTGDPALGLPNGFAGTATITSSDGLLAGIVNEIGPGGQFSSYDLVNAPSRALYEPIALNNAYGGYYTGMGIQNTSATAGTVTITYYNASGAAAFTKAFSIPGRGYLAAYQGSPSDGPPEGAYAAKITSGLPLAAVVNEVLPSNAPVKQATAYAAFAAGAATLGLPLLENAGADGWSTGEGIMNVGSAATTVSVTYYDTSTGKAVGTAQTLTLQPNAQWGLYQPAGGLPTGTRASAVVSTTGGGTVVVICNEANASTFMSYSGQ